MYTTSNMNGLDLPVWKYRNKEDKPLGYINIKDFMNEGFQTLPDEIELVRTLAYNHNEGSELIKQLNREIINQTHILFTVDSFYVCLISPYMLFDGVLEIASHVYQSAVVGLSELSDQQLHDLMRTDRALKKIIQLTRSLISHMRKIKTFHNVIFKNFTVKFHKYVENHPYLQNHPEITEIILECFRANWNVKYETHDIFIDETWKSYQLVYVGIDKIQNCLDDYLHNYIYHANRKYRTMEVWASVRDEFFTIAYRPDMFKKIVLDEKEVDFFQ